jgi:integrase
LTVLSDRYSIAVVLSPHTYICMTKDRLNDIFLHDFDTFAHLRAMDPELPDHVWSVMIRFRPQLSPVQWEAVREFTISNAVQMKPRTFETVRRLMTMTARFNAWAWTAGSALDVARMYTNANVYRYLQERHRKHSDSHRWGLVRQLGTVADMLAETSVARMPSLSRNVGPRPFSLPEIAQLHSWAGTLTTDLKRQNAWAILGLAGGAGLRSEEIVTIRIGDLDVTDGRLFVTVPGPRARRVPVTQPWTRTLLKSIATRSNPMEDVFRGYRLDEYPPRVIQSFLTDHPGRLRATISRLRCTWVVTHLNNEVPTQALLAIAGFSSAGSLDKYLPHVRPFNLHTVVGRIVGEEVAR